MQLPDADVRNNLMSFELYFYELFKGRFVFEVIFYVAVIFILL